MNTTHGILLAAFSLATALPAQSPPQQPEPTLETHSIGQHPNLWRVPIHEHAPDPIAGRYGVWAAGPGYKVSFHDGMELHPVLGPTASRGLPMKWTTSRVAIGDNVLLEDDASTVASEQMGDWRFAYEFEPGVREIYDVGPAGVEQSFVVQQPALTSTGALTIEGELRSDLSLRRIAVRDSIQAEVSFTDGPGGREVFRYGAALAFDAAGHRTPVATTIRQSASGKRIVLTVPEDFVANATWPITVDPLLAPNTIFATTDSIVSSDVSVSTGPSTQRVMTVWTVAITATDEDVYAYSSETNFNNENLVFSDLSTSIQSRDPSVAFVRSAGPNGRWAIAFERLFVSQARIRVWLHDEGNTTAQSGVLMFLPASGTGNIERNPALGGSPGSAALLTYQTDTTANFTNTATTEVRYTFVNAATETFQNTNFVSPPSSIRDSEAPAVTHCADTGDEDWIVCFQQRPLITGGTWRIRGRRISRFGTDGTETTLLSSNSTLTPNMIQPAVDGKFGAFVVSGIETSGTTNGTRIAMQRFDWGNSTSPNLLWREDVANTGVISPFRELSIAHDTVSRSHWGIAYRQGNDLRLLRVGFNGDTVGSELASSTSGVRAPAIAFDEAGWNYVHTFAMPSLFGNAIAGQLWTYPNDAAHTTYGTLCGSGGISASLRPLLGDQAWFTTLTGGLPNTPAALFIGFSPAAVDLTAIGMGGCTLLIGGPITAIPASADATGRASFGLDLISAIDVYLQWVHVAPGANPLGVQATQGLVAHIR